MGFAGLEPMESNILLLLLVILLLIGLILAYAGWVVYKKLMGFLGAIVGAFYGFDIGYNTLQGGFLVGAIGAVVGAIVGALIFHFIVDFAIAVFCGLLAAGVVITVLGTSQVLVAVIVGVVVGALAWYFIREIIGVATALMGGMISGFALLNIDDVLGWKIKSVIVLLAIFIFITGAIVQVKAAERDRGAGRGKSTGKAPEEEPERKPKAPPKRKNEDKDE
jgi:hypothetical protein